MITSQAGIEMLKRLEALRTKPYRDSGGVWTVGYGHTRSAAALAEVGLELTTAQCEALLRLDLAAAEAAVQQLGATLTQYQFDACVSFAFNIGAEAFKRSTFARMLRERNYDGAAAEFQRWVYDGGKRSKGLANRREAERALFLGHLAPLR